MRPFRLTTAVLLLWAAHAAAESMPGLQTAPGLPPIALPPFPPDVQLPASTAPPQPALIDLALQPPPAIMVAIPDPVATSIAIGLEPVPEAGDPAAAFAQAAPAGRAPALTLALPPLAEMPPLIAMVPPAAPAIVAPAAPPIPDAPATAWRERLERAMPPVAAAAPFLPQPVLEAVRGYYDGREGRPLFSDHGKLTAQGRAVLDSVARADSHGLTPQRFDRLVALARTGSADEAELALAALAVSYARDARGARLNPLQVSRLITAKPTIPEPQAILDGLAQAPQAAGVLDLWNPQHAGYQALKQQLERMRVQEHTASVPGRMRPSAEGDIIANMERWRWLPADLGASHVLVNVPGYRLEMNRDGRKVFETRVIVGKPDSPTPIFSQAMEYLVVNPYWNVPPSIAMKEYLPLLKANPYALQARGLQIVNRGRIVDPASIDWSRMPRSLAIRQPPGERNALGNIKFMFPNDHAVYLHDTPSRGLFSAGRRAFSHGCVRVQNPFALASAVSGWNEGRLRSMVGGAERRLDLPGEVQVHLAYFTLEAEADGTLTPREDLYGHHRRMKRLMGL